MFFLAEFATAVAGWVLEINPFDQPNVAGGQGRDQARARRRAAARRCRVADDAALRALLARRRPGGYIALMGYVAPSLEFDEAVAELRATLMRATRARDDVRLRPALPALDRPAAQGRPADRALPLADRRRGTRRRDPAAPSYSFRTLKTRRRSATCETLRAHGLPAEIVRLERRPGGGAARPPQQDQGDALMQIGFVGLGKMGGNMVARIRRDSDHEVVAFDFDARRSRAPRKPARRGAATLRELVKAARAAAHRSGSWSPPATRRRRRSTRWRSCSTPTTRSSTAATRAGPTTRTRAAAAAPAEDPLRRRRHQRRRVGPRGRLLHDGRRPGAGGQAPRADPRRAGARRRRADSVAAIGPRGWEHFGPRRRATT